jgi:peptidoglycan/xylan/chitin deacetylase (PgdA/CDA1 family)
MKITKSFSKTRSLRNLLRRVGTILGRFGVSSRRMGSRLNRYIDITRKGGCVPTFPLTAVTLKRHPALIRKLCGKGVEFAVHGYIHADYGVAPFEEQVRHFKKARDTFSTWQIPFTGFRAPYLRISEQTPWVLSNLGFLYDSSRVISWDVVDNSKYPGARWSNYETLLDFYQTRSAQEYLALPRFTSGIVEIPVSIPDDEAIVDRLGISDEEEITRVWRAIFEETYDRGELFTIQLHPERILLCERALTHVVRRAKKLNPLVWVASLGEIADWWNEKDRFSLEVNSEGSGRYRVKATCSEKATLLLKNCKASVPMTEWSSGYQSTRARDFVMGSPKYPIIGVGFDTSPKAVSFLQSEGFVVEQSSEPDKYGIYLNDLTDFQVTDEKPLSEMIERSDVPLVRYWRWPYRARSALTITGDIDAITLIDFGLRLFETWRQNGRHKPRC